MFSQSDGTFQCQCKPGIYGEKCDIGGTYTVGFRCYI